MKRIVLILLLLPAAGRIYAASDWDSAVLTYGENSSLQPYRMIVSTRTFNGKGTLEKTEELTYLLSYDENGETGRQLVRAFENGEDITEKKRRETRRGGPPEEMQGLMKHPLDPEVQNDVQASDTGMTEYKKGRLCAVWDFSIKLNEKYSGRGTAWLDSDTGEAVSMNYGIEPLFPFVEEMNIGLDFDTAGNDQWVLNRLSMSARINMLIMKKSFDSVTEFSDYR